MHAMKPTPENAVSVNTSRLLRLYLFLQRTNHENALKHIKSTSRKWNLYACFKMKLVVQILTGTLFYIEVDEDATVRELKKKIGDQENLPSDRLILMLDGDQRSMMDDNGISLKEYGVQDSSHIYIFFEPLDYKADLQPPIPWDFSSDPTWESFPDPPSPPVICISDNSSSSCELVNEYMDIESSPNVDPSDKDN